MPTIEPPSEDNEKCKMIKQPTVEPLRINTFNTALANYKRAQKAIADSLFEEMVLRVIAIANHNLLWTPTKQVMVCEDERVDVISVYRAVLEDNDNLYVEGSFSDGDEASFIVGISYALDFDAVTPQDIGVDICHNPKCQLQLDV